MSKKLKSILECDKCGSDQIKVYNSRETMGIRWRGRECMDCGNRFTTYEISKEDLDKLLEEV